MKELIDAFSVVTGELYPLISVMGIMLAFWTLTRFLTGWLCIGGDNESECEIEDGVPEIYIPIEIKKLMQKYDDMEGEK